MFAQLALATFFSFAPPASAATAPPPENPDGPTKDIVIDHIPGQGVRIATGNGRFSFQTWLRTQLRDTFVHTPGTPDDLHHTLELKRLSLFFAGNVFGPHNKYFVQLVFDPRDLGLTGGQVTQSPIFDVILTFDYLRDLSIRVGQYKPFFSRQFIGGWGDLQFVDRASMQGEFLLDRDLGFDLFSNDLGGLDKLRYSVGVYAGQGRNNIQARDFHMTYLARFEVLPLGGFDEYVESDLERRAQPKLALGAAYAFQDDARLDRGVSGAVPADGGTTDMHSVVGDMMFKWRGFSANGEVFWRYGQRTGGDEVDDLGEPIPVVAPRNGLGWFAQGGYLLPMVPVEFAVRGGQLLPLGTTSMPATEELGGGLSWYLRGHALKLQADYFHTWIGAGIADGSNMVRLQLQVGI